MKWELCLVLPLLLPSASLALPSNAPYYDSNGPHQAALRVDGASEEHFQEWRQPPHPNSTHHLIFGSVSGLLQRWPNTYRRNGALDPFSFHRSCLPDACSFERPAPLFRFKATTSRQRPSPEVQSYTMDVPTIIFQMFPNGLGLALNTPICFA